MQDPNEQWQAQVNGETYDASFAELTAWIAESALLETDKVRRGKLRWLDAGKVPPLREFFNAKELGVDPPEVQVTVTDGSSSEEFLDDAVEQQTESGHNLSDNQFAEQTVDASNEPKTESNSSPLEDTPPDPNFCSIHSEVESKYVCKTCFHPFCKSCPQSFGSSVKICPYCGAMCDEVKAFHTEQQRETQYRSDISGGFGFDDFGKALAYPFKFKSSLFFGGLLIAIFGFGQNAANMGSFFLIAAALICIMLANAITFGVLANTIDNFAKGFTDKDFFPSFEDFSLWDDVVHPFLLSVAVYISSFGIFFALVFGIVWYAWSSFASQMAGSKEAAVAQLEKTSQQSQSHVEKLKQKYRSQNQGRTGIKVGPDGLTEGQRASLTEEAEFQSLNDLANNFRKSQLESTIGQTPETQEAQNRALLGKFIKVAGVFIFFAGLALLWGLFYFPAACAVAGYTRSFFATLNPLVGLDTIRHLGFDYLKILLMTFLMSVASGMVGLIFALIFFPFNLPRFGNLPAQFVGSFVTFYFSVVFAVTLGYALYKNSAKLKLHRG